MASVFAHAISAVALGKVMIRIKQPFKFWLLAMFCAIIPDADVLSFNFGIPYDHVFGHRGFTHSFFFSFILGNLVVLIFFHEIPRLTREWWFMVLIFSLCTASHAILDAMTTGGLGVAFFAPFDNDRYFLPWRVIKVSPISISSFFSEWGWKVIKSELLCVGLPSLIVILFSEFFRRVE